jgi:hypothetical protein
VVKEDLFESSEADWTISAVVHADCFVRYRNDLSFACLVGSILRQGIWHATNCYRIWAGKGAIVALVTLSKVTILNRSYFYGFLGLYHREASASNICHLN